MFESWIVPRPSKSRFSRDPVCTVCTVCTYTRLAKALGPLMSVSLHEPHSHPCIVLEATLSPAHCAASQNTNNKCTPHTSAVHFISGSLEPLIFHMHCANTLWGKHGNLNLLCLVLEFVCFLISIPVPVAFLFTISWIALYCQGLLSLQSNWYWHSSQGKQGTAPHGKATALCDFHRNAIQRFEPKECEMDTGKQTHKWFATRIKYDIYIYCIYIETNLWMLQYAVKGRVLLSRPQRSSNIFEHLWALFVQRILHQCMSFRWVVVSYRVNSSAPTPTPTLTLSHSLSLSLSLPRAPAVQAGDRAWPLSLEAQRQFLPQFLGLRRLRLLVYASLAQNSTKDQANLDLSRSSSMTLTSLTWSRLRTFWSNTNQYFLRTKDMQQMCSSSKYESYERKGAFLSVWNHSHSPSQSSHARSCPVMPASRRPKLRPAQPALPQLWARRLSNRQ